MIQPTDGNGTYSQFEKVRGDVSKIAKESGIGLSGAFTGILLHYLLVMVLTRFLSPTEYGTFVLGQAVINILLVFVLLGTPRVLDRFISFFNASGDQGKTKTLIYGIFQIVLAISFVMALLIYFLSGYIGQSLFANPQLSNILRIMSLSVPMLAFIQLVSFTFIGFKELRYQGYVEYVTYPLLMLGFALIALVCGYGLVVWTWMYIFSLLGASMLGFLFLTTITFRLLKRTSRKPISVREIAAFSWPVCINALLIIIIGHATLLLLGYFRTPEEVAIYRIYFLLASILSIVHDSIGRIYKPIVSGHVANMEREKIREIYQRVSKWSITINMFFIGLFITLGQTLIQTLFSREYGAAFYSFAILLGGQFVNSVLGHQGKSLEAFGNVRLLLVNGTTLLVVTLFLDLLLIPRYGIYGAAIASASGLMAANMLAYTEVQTLYGLNLLDSKYFKIVMLLLITIFSLLATRWLIGFSNVGIANILAALGFLLFYVPLVIWVICDEHDRWILGSICVKIIGRGGTG